MTLHHWKQLSVSGRKRGHVSRLELFGRPYVVFDPENKKHRSYYHEFVRSGTWGHCPVRFVVPEDHGDLITMIQRSLVKFYVAKEFDLGRKEPVAKKPQKKVSQKTKKTVDN
jgi:hypothetical protein